MFRYPVKASVSWRIISELFRRHHAACKLILLETHPGGGTYDCLSVYTHDTWVGYPDKHLFDINVASGNIHIFGYYGAPRRETKYEGPDKNIVRSFLEADDGKELIDYIEEKVGLPKLQGSLPATTAPVLCFRIIAGLLERYMLARDWINVSCGWYDSSGYEGSYIRKELLEFPGIAEAMPGGKEKWEKQARAASRYWLIEKRNLSGELILKAVIDLRGKAMFTDAANEPIDLWQEFVSQGHDVGKLIDEIDRRIRMAYGEKKPNMSAGIKTSYDYF